MDLDQSVKIVQQCVDNTSTTVKDAQLIIEAWQQIKTQLLDPVKK